MTEIYPKHKARGISAGKALKTYIKNELELMLTDRLFEIKNEGATTSLKISQVKIADIVFAFNNADLIDLLRERGGHIMY
jgi:hypothetical protein